MLVRGRGFACHGVSGNADARVQVNGQFRVVHSAGIADIPSTSEIVHQ